MSEDCCRFHWEVRMLCLTNLQYLWNLKKFNFNPFKFCSPFRFNVTWFGHKFNDYWQTVVRSDGIVDAAVASESNAFYELVRRLLRCFHLKLIIVYFSFQNSNNAYIFTNRCYWGVCVSVGAVCTTWIDSLFQIGFVCRVLLQNWIKF